MAAVFFDSPLSKWQIFAREFILHMESELYNPPMTTDQVAFVEEHADQIAEVQKLAVQYHQFIRQELKVRLEQCVPGSTFDIRETTWPSSVLVFRCGSPPQWGDNDLVLFKPEGTGQKFFIRAYLDYTSEPRLSKATRALELGQPVPCAKYSYWTSAGYDSREEAIAGLCKLAQVATDLLKEQFRLRCLLSRSVQP